MYIASRCRTEVVSGSKGSHRSSAYCRLGTVNLPLDARWRVAARSRDTLITGRPRISGTTVSPDWAEAKRVRSDLPSTEHVECHQAYGEDRDHRGFVVLKADAYTCSQSAGRYPQSSWGRSHISLSSRSTSQAISRLPQCSHLRNGPSPRIVRVRAKPDANPYGRSSGNLQASWAGVLCFCNRLKPHGLQPGTEFVPCTNSRSIRSMSIFARHTVETPW